MDVMLINALNNQELMKFQVEEMASDTLKAKLIESYIGDFSNIGPHRLSVLIGHDRINAEIVSINRDTSIVTFKLDILSKDANRKYERIKIYDPFIIRIKPELNSVEVTGINISFGGMRIRTKAKLSIGQEIVVELLTTFNKFYFDARVMNETPSQIPRQKEFGIMFTEEHMRREQSDALYDYILRKDKENRLGA